VSEVYPMKFCIYKCM